MRYVRERSEAVAVRNPASQVAEAYAHPDGIPTGKQQVSAVIAIPVGVKEIQIDLSRERLIRVVGRDRMGRRVERHLKVTDKGKLALV